MSEWYRELLGWKEFPELADLRMEKVGFRGRLSALLRWHPDDVVRVGVALGLISVGLGLLGMFSALFLYSVQAIARGGYVDFVSGTVLLIFAAISLAAGAPTVTIGFWALLRGAPKPTGP